MGPRENEPGVGGLPYEMDLKGRWMGHPFVVFEGENDPCCSTPNFIKQAYTAVRYDFTRIFIANELVIV